MTPRHAAVFLFAMACVWLAVRPIDAVQMGGAALLIAAFSER